MRQRFFTVVTDCMEDGTRESIVKGDILSCSFLHRVSWSNSDLAVVFIKEQGYILCKLSLVGNTCTLSFKNPNWKSVTLLTSNIVGVYAVESLQRYKYAVSREQQYFQEKLMGAPIKQERRRRLELRQKVALEKFSNTHPIKL